MIEHRHPARGYAMALTAALLWGFNGTVSKVTLKGAFSSLQLVELRSLGAFVVLAAVLDPFGDRRGGGRPGHAAGPIQSANCRPEMRS